MTKELIKKIREKSGHTQHSLAKAMNYQPSAGSISKWETGERGINMETFLEVCQAANVKPSEIFKEIGL